MAATAKQSGLVYHELFANLLATCIHHFINSPGYLGKGLEMLTKFLSIVQPTGDTTKIAVVCKLVSCIQAPDEDADTFMRKMRESATSLAGVLMEDMLLLFSLVAMNKVC